MYPLFFIAKNNLKKKKGEVLVLLFLTALAAFLLYTSISVLTGTGKVMDTAYDDTNSADYLFIINAEKEERLEKLFKEQKAVTEFETGKCFYVIDGKYRKTKKEEKKEYQFLVGTIEEERTIGKLTGIDTENVGYSDIILPYYLFLSGNYQIGDPFFLTLAGKEFEFEITGYKEDPLLATPMAASIFGIYVSESCMEDMIKECPVLESNLCTQYKMRLTKGESSADFEEAMLKQITREMPEIVNITNLSLNWETMKAGTGMMPNISMGIILVFSVLLVLVATIIIRFSIRNFIEKNLKNVGILQASGYTAKQLQFISILEMGLLAVIGIGLGILAGILGSEATGSLLGGLLGIHWNQGVDIKTIVFVICIAFAVIVGTAAMTSRVYRKVKVLDALRGGIATHNFRKNYFPFEKSRLPKNLVLAGKHMFGEKATNLSIFCIMAVLSFATCVGFELYENFAGNTDFLLQLVGMECGDVYLSGDMESLESVGVKLEDWPEVEKVLYYTNYSVELSKGEKKRTVTCDIWKEPDLNEYETILEGRLPKYDNEVVLTTICAKELNVKVGDIIYVEAQNGKKDYLVCGIDQKMNNMGRKVLMNIDGGRRLSDKTQIDSLYLFTEDDITFEEMEKKLEKHYPELKVQDINKVMKESISGVVAGMSMICIVFVCVTVFVVAMVEILLVRSRITKERRNYGINKALGYTTRQLMVETMMMNMPVVLFGAICGAVLNIFLINPLSSLCLTTCGIAKCDIPITPGWLVITVIGIVVLAAGISFLSAIRIQKIEPVKMLVEE